MSEASRNENPDNSVTVDIYDQSYRLRGQDAAYIHQLAAIVDNKMRLVASQGKTVDSLRVAVLAALNIADELARAEAKLHEVNGNASDIQNIRSRANSLTGLLDSLLTDERRIG
jgi:cell division protein ZapA